MTTVSNINGSLCFKNLPLYVIMSKCILLARSTVSIGLFQTSCKNAVETTELTRSFGWDSSEAWQQHDIQELCRVMFDALEQEFKDTEQFDLIDRLYQGKFPDFLISYIHIDFFKYIYILIIK